MSYLRSFKGMSLLTIAIMLAVMFVVQSAQAQLSDLDLLEDDDRSIGASVSRAPDTITGEDNETRAAIILVPLTYGEEDVTFEGGVGAYYTSSGIAGETSSVFQWRVQGGPQYGILGLQGYIEGIWNGRVDYAGFVRLGEFDIGHIILSAGFGTLVRAGTETDISVGIERAGAGGGDTVVKGLVLASAEVDTTLFDSLRFLAVAQPGFDGELDYFGEAQVSYQYGKIRLGAFAKVGQVEGAFVKQYTGIVSVPF